MHCVGLLRLRSCKMQGPGKATRGADIAARMLTALGTSSETAAAKDCLLRAITIAQQQDAKALERRAALPRSCLWHPQGKEQEANALLEPVYHWFTEGLDTGDVQAVAAVLSL